MFYWRPGALADALREERVSEEDKLKYLLASSVLTVLLGASGVSQDLPSFGLSIVYAAAIAAGVVLCYQANRDGDARHFLERFICLGFLIMLRWVLLSYILYYLAFGVLTWGFAWDSTTFATRTAPVYPTYLVVLQLIFYLWLRVYIRRAASGPPTDEPVQLVT